MLELFRWSVQSDYIVIPNHLQKIPLNLKNDNDTYYKK
jgi:hypothetical protein